MCEVVCDGVHDGVERQMGTRRSDDDLYTHARARTHPHTLLLPIYNACDIYEPTNQPKKLDLSTQCVYKKRVCSQIRMEE